MSAFLKNKFIKKNRFDRYFYVAVLFPVFVKLSKMVKFDPERINDILIS